MTAEEHRNSVIEKLIDIAEKYSKTTKLVREIWAKETLAELFGSVIVDVPLIETCDVGHKFAYLADHPMRDGHARCPHCMIIRLANMEQ